MHYPYDNTRPVTHCVLIVLRVLADLLTESFRFIFIAFIYYYYYFNIGVSRFMRRILVRNFGLVVQRKKKKKKSSISQVAPSSALRPVFPRERVTSGRFFFPVSLVVTSRNTGFIDISHPHHVFLTLR